MWVFANFHEPQPEDDAMSPTEEEKDFEKRLLDGEKCRLESKHATHLSIQTNLGELKEERVIATFRDVFNAVSPGTLYSI